MLVISLYNTGGGHLHHLYRVSPISLHALSTVPGSTAELQAGAESICGTTQRNPQSRT